jgi:hypothetical protein
MSVVPLEIACLFHDKLPYAISRLIRLARDEYFRLTTHAIINKVD